MKPHKREWLIKLQNAGEFIKQSAFSQNHYTELQAYVLVSDQNKQYAHPIYNGDGGIRYWIEPENA